jgi:malate/lactate dehydrogenase
MFVAKFASKATARSFAARAMSTKKVAVLGAGGGIGQPLSLLLKLSPLVDELACYDIVGTPGVAADLSHVSACACTYVESDTGYANTSVDRKDNSRLLT